MVFSIFFIFYIWRCFYLFLFYLLHLKVYILCGFFYWFTFKFILYHFFFTPDCMRYHCFTSEAIFFTPKCILYTWRYSLSFCYCTWGYTLSGFLTHSVFSIVFLHLKVSWIVMSLTVAPRTPSGVIWPRPWARTTTNQIVSSTNKLTSRSYLTYRYRRWGGQI